MARGATRNLGRRGTESLGLPELDRDCIGASQLHSLFSGDPVEEVSTALLLLESAGAKMLKLEDVVDDLLEAEGGVLVEAVVEHVLMCFWSQDP
jgi:hypothetical protein